MAVPGGPGGGGGNSTSTHNHTPHGPGSKPPKHPHVSPHDGTGHPQGTTGSTGGGGYTYGGGSSTHPDVGPGTRRAWTPPAWIIRRQQILKRAGFGTAVDGIWGANSQQAWNAWNAGQHAGTMWTNDKGVGNRRPELPPGFTYYKGRVVTKAAASAGAAVDHARNLAANSPSFSQHILSEGGGHLPAVGKRGNPKALRSAIGPTQRGQAAQAAADVRTQQDINRNEIATILGKDGYLGLARNGLTPTQYVGKNGSIRDINLLIASGAIKATDPDAIRAVQSVLKRSGAKVDVTGTFDQATATALESATREMIAHDEHTRIEAFRKAYQRDGIGEYAAVRFYGKPLSADELYGKLALGGTAARKAAAYIAQMSVISQSSVEVQIQSLAHNAWITQHNGKAPAQEHFSHEQVLQLLGPEYAKAINSNVLPAFFRNYALAMDTQRRAAAIKQHASSPGFWGTAVGGLFDGLGYLSYQASHIVFSAQNFTTNLTDYAIDSAFGIEHKNMSAHNRNLYYSGIISPHDAWKNGWIEQSELRKRDPWGAVIIESLFDPLNFVGVGEISAAGRATSKAAKLFSARGLAFSEGDLLVRSSPAIATGLSHGFEGLDKSIDAISKLPGGVRKAGGAYGEWSGYADWWAKGTRMKASAISAVHEELNTATRLGLRKVTEFTPTALGGDLALVDKAATVLAPHVKAAERLALTKATNTDDVVTKLPADLAAAHEEAFQGLVNLIHQDDFGIMGPFLAAKTPIYRHLNRNSTLSKAGHWVEAAAMEAGTTVALREAARVVANGDDALERELLAGIGTYAAGHADVRLLAVAQEMTDRWERIVYDQLLPALDDIGKRQLDRAAWDADGFFLEEGTAAARQRFEEAYNFEFAALFGEKVTVPNPNYGTVMSKVEGELLRQDEETRRFNMIVRWANDATFLAERGGEDASGIIAKANELKSALTKELDAAYETVDGGIRDTRKTFEIPAAYVRDAAGVPSQGFGQLAQHFLIEPDATATPAQAARAKTYQETALTHRELLEKAKTVLASRVYAKHWLFLQSAKYSQHLYWKGLYYGLNAGLQTWKFFSLAMRPGYVVKNTIDNFAKAMIRGLHDPALIFNANGTSIFELAQYRALKAAAKMLDLTFGTTVAESLDNLVLHFWEQHPDVLERIVGEHGIPFPKELFENRSIHAMDDAVSVGKRNLYQRFTDTVWDLAGARPENYAKRAMFAHRYRTVLKATGDEDLATKAGLDEVEHTLFNFDAASTSVLEDQLKVMFPFISFWRKNTQFWADFVINDSKKAIWGYHLYGAYEQSNNDMPDNLRRYVSASPLGSVFHAIPGASWLAQDLMESYTDPVNLLSMGSYYRSFKGDNQFLPENQAGGSFLAPIVTALTDIGLTGNPFWTKIGETTGMLDRHSWQNIFPETGFIQGIAQGMGWGPKEGFNLEHLAEDEIIQKLDLDVTTNKQLTLEAFDSYVNRYVANSIAKGAPVTRAQGEAHIRQWLAMQQVVMFTTGIALRQINDSDIAFAKLREHMAEHPNDDTFFKLTEGQQEAYRLWKHTYDYDPARFDAYRGALEGARSYYQIGDYNERQAFLQANPDVQMVIDEDNQNAYARNPELFIQHQLLSAETGTTMDLLTDVFDNPDFKSSVNAAAQGVLVTPQLKAFWARNDTPTEIRTRQIRANYYHYVSRMQQAYFSIPATDFDRRSAYLAQHPELSESWARNDSAGDDYRSIFNASVAPMRDIYFKFVEAGDWDGAQQYLQNHSFIFDYTSAEGRVTPDGNWLPRSDVQQAYAKVSDKLAVYYTLSAADREAYAAANPLITWYLNKYSHSSGLHAQAMEYDKLRHTLDSYFNLPKGALRSAFLANHPELLAYFKKYTGHHGAGTTSQHARDYLAVKSQLDAFFALPDGDKAAWLAKHPEVQAYFKKYGSAKHHAAFRGHMADDPEIAKRYDFWQQFFALNPVKRAAFIHTNAKKAGIFIYGSLSYNQQVKEEEQWHRESVRFGISERAAAYRHIKPLMDVYFKLTKSSDKSLFLELNPELNYYFTHFGKQPDLSPKLQKELATYSSFQVYSDDRKQYLIDHPELQHYFSSTGSAAEKAIFVQVEQFFRLPFDQRSGYLYHHPELNDWFDKRAAEKQAYQSIAAAFNETDPRMKPYYEMYADIIPMDALKQWQLSHQHGKKWVYQEHDKNGSRRERNPERVVEPGLRSSSL